VPSSLAYRRHVDDAECAGRGRLVDRISEARTI
jgi:hypothetical protein